MKVQQAIKDHGCVVISIPFINSLIHGVSQIKITKRQTYLNIGGEIKKIKTRPDFLLHKMDDIDDLVTIIVSAGATQL